MRPGSWFLMAISFLSLMLLPVAAMCQASPVESNHGLSTASSYDLSTQNYFPPILSQGSQGSCAAWAITYYAYGYMEAKRCGWTDAHTGNVSHIFSPAWTFNKVNHGYQFSDLWDNAEIIRTLGACTWDYMPYNVSDIHSLGSDAAYADALTHMSNATTTLSFITGNPYFLLGEIKVLVSEDTPVCIAMYFNGFTRVHGLNSTPIGDNLVSSNEYNFSQWVNHAVCIVGYDDAYTQPDTTDVGAFKCANSWGTNIGDHGYFWVSYATMVGIGTQLSATYMTPSGSAYVPPVVEPEEPPVTPPDGNTTPPVIPDNGTVPIAPVTNNTTWNTTMVTQRGEDFFGMMVLTFFIIIGAAIVMKVKDG